MEFLPPVAARVRSTAVDMKHDPTIGWFDAAVLPTRCATPSEVDPWFDRPPSTMGSSQHVGFFRSTPYPPTGWHRRDGGGLKWTPTGAPFDDTRSGTIYHGLAASPVMEVQNRNLAHPRPPSPQVKAQMLGGVVRLVKDIHGMDKADLGVRTPTL